MPEYPVTLPDGRVVPVTAPNEKAAAEGAAQWAKANPAPRRRSAAEDGARSIGSGIVRGLAGLADAGPAGIMTRAANQALELTSRRGRLPTPQQSAETGGGGYKPQTRGGRYLQTGGEMLPNAFMGPAGLVRRSAQVVVPAVTGEGARELASAVGLDEAGQALAKTFGAITGGIGAGARLRNAPPQPAARNAFLQPPNTTQQAVDAQGGVNALAQEFGVPLTKGQANRNYGQISFEQAAARGARGERAGEVMRGGFQAQRQAVREAGTGMAPKPYESPYQAAGAVREGVRSTAQQAKGRVDEAYSAIRSSKEGISAPTISDLPRRLDEALNTEFFSPEAMTSLNPRTTAIYGEIKRLAGSAPKLPDGTPDPAWQLPVAGVERVRQGIVSAAKTAQGNDQAALQIMRREFDGWLDDVVDDHLLTGAAANQLKQARRMHRDYRQTYGGGSGRQAEADRIMQKLLTDETTDTDAANLLFGRSQITGATGPVEVARRVKTATSAQGETWDAMRSGAVLRLMQKAEKQADAIGSDYKGMANEWTEALEGSGAPLMRELFSAEELTRMRRFRDLLNQLSPPEGTVNRSNSGYELARLLRQTLGPLGSLTPVVNKMLDAYTNVATAGRARRAVEPSRLSLRQALTQSAPGASRAAIPGALVTGPEQEPLER